MKKLHILLAAGIAMAMSSCNEDFVSTDSPQSNPQENILQASDVTVTPASGLVVDYSTSDPSDTIALGDVAVVAEKEPANSYIQATDIEISLTEDFEKTATVPCVSMANTTKVGIIIQKLQDAVFSTGLYVSSNPVNIYARTVLKLVQNSTSESYVGGPKAYYSLGTINYTPKPVLYTEYIYAPGNQQGWNPATAAALHSPNSDGIYKGYIYLDGNFKFTKAQNWGDGEYNWTHFTTVPSFFVNDDGTNIDCKEAGLYDMTVNIGAGSIEVNKINTVTLIGSAINGDTTWGTDSDPMVWSSDKGAYTLIATLTAGEFKIRADKDWKISWGYTEDGATTHMATATDGNNISVTAGTYQIVFKPACDGKAEITVTPVDPED